MRGRDGDSLIRVAPLDPEAFAGRGARPDGAPGALVVADPEALRLHGRALPRLPVIEVPRGEAAKSLASLEVLWGAFLDAGLDRGSTVIAFGGGATSDLAGFAAATWLRGIAFEYLPTTLLAMVDAAVGGKTAIDFRGRKNMVGAFSQPRRVLCDVAFLDTLSDTEFASGMAEVAKHAVLAGGGYAALVEGLGGRRPRASEPGGRELLEGIVAGSVALKAAVVGRDEREAGERRHLNLGHTLGHALESTLGIPHGHAVAAGIAWACRLSARRGAMDGETVSRIVSLLSSWSLPATIGEALSLARLRGEAGPRAAEGETRSRVAEALAADKKRGGGDIAFVLPRGLGKVETVGIPLAELAAFVMEAP